jgi:hypothetical protein
MQDHTKYLYWIEFNSFLKKLLEQKTINLLVISLIGFLLIILNLLMMTQLILLEGLYPLSTLHIKKKLKLNFFLII